MSFEEWFNSENPFNGNENNEDCLWAKKWMKVSYESRQAEIDELQERIDEALDRLNNTYPENWGYEVSCAIEIIKGETNE